MKKYSEEHQWAEKSGEVVRVGVSVFAASELGEVSFVELPDVEKSVERGGGLCVVESLKAAADVVSPVGGHVVRVNEVLALQPSLLNESPEENGWICELSGVSEEDMTALMDSGEYAVFLSKA